MQFKWIKKLVLAIGAIIVLFMKSNTLDQQLAHFPIIE